MLIIIRASSMRKTCVILLFLHVLDRCLLKDKRDFKVKKAIKAFKEGRVQQEVKA